jgi:DNA-binding IscR family transcriptional regulator
LIRLLEGPLAPLPCASETAFRRCDECVDEKRCGTRIVMKRVRDAMAAILDTTTLADVCNEVDALKEADRDEPLMYYI